MVLKRLLSTLLVGFGCLSCTSSESPAQASNVLLVKEANVLFNQHDWKELGKLFADSMCIKEPDNGTQIIKKSKQQQLNKLQTMHQTFPNLSRHITQLYASGNHHVIVEAITEGLAADSSQLSQSTCTIFTVENGKISREYTYHLNLSKIQ